MKLEVFGDDNHWSAHGEYEPAVDPKLKPCPFCGSTDLDVSNTHTPCYIVSCECGAEMTGGITESGRITSRKRCIALHEKAQRLAIEAWNRRAK